MTEIRRSLFSKVQPSVGLFCCVVLLTSADGAPKTTLDYHGLETVLFRYTDQMCSYVIMLMSSLVIRMNNNELPRLLEKNKKTH